MLTRRSILGLILAATACTSSMAQPTPLDQAVALLRDVSGVDARPFSTRDFGREPYPQARSVLVPKDNAEQLLRTLKPKLPAGIVGFVGVTNSHARPKPSGVELVVAEGATQFDILRVAASDGINHGLKTEDLIRELQAWDREYGVEIWQAETDVVQLRLKTLPRNLPEFATRVYKFCPDIVDQGVGSVRALERQIARDKSVFLWWD